MTILGGKGQVWWEEDICLMDRMHWFGKRRKVEKLKASKNQS